MVIRQVPRTANKCHVGFFPREITVVNLTNHNIITPSKFANIMLQQQLKFIPSNAHLHVIENGSTTIWGYYPAYKIVYQYNTPFPNDNRIVMDFLTVIGNRGYIFNYIAQGYQKYSLFLSSIQQMIDSFKIINTTQLKSSGNEIEATNFAKYKNITLGIGATYPVNWTVEDGYYDKKADMVDTTKGIYYNYEIFLGKVVRFLSPFEDSKPFSWYRTQYDMAINVEPVYNTGSSYHLDIIWEPSGKNWTRDLVETAKTHASTAGV